MTWTKQLGTKHVDGCRRRFKYYDMSCLRCRELAGGAEPRKGWFTPYQLVDNFRKCSHYNDNAGGYCNICGNGRDFS